VTCRWRAPRELTDAELRRVRRVMLRAAIHHIAAEDGLNAGQADTRKTGGVVLELRQPSEEELRYAEGD
jgi:hypothetical protein